MTIMCRSIANQENLNRQGARGFITEGHPGWVVLRVKVAPVALEAPALSLVWMSVLDVSPLTHSHPLVEMFEHCRRNLVAVVIGPAPDEGIETANNKP
ncbi:MAG: hypothetical protein WBA10_03090, partial [Elainellaceae cyanobacterium]